MSPIQKEGPSLSTDELISLFVSTITDVYLTKSKLIDYLPLMARMASRSELKMVILDCGNSISLQLLRLNMLPAILKQTHLSHVLQPVEMFDLDNYLGRDIKGNKNAKTDALLLIHLSMIEGMEVTSFLLLQKLAFKLQHRELYDLLKKNLLDAIRNKKELDLLLDAYFPV